MSKQIVMASSFFSLSLILAGCGYQVAGHTTVIPKTVQSIAVPTFKNETQRFKIEQEVTAAVVRELRTRTRYNIRATENVDDADAVLKGTVTAYWSSPVVFDTTTQRATTSVVNMKVRVALTDRKTGKLLYENLDLQFQEHYEIGEGSNYFDESNAAMLRMSRTLATTLVSSILESF